MSHDAWVLLSHPINTHPISCTDGLVVDTIALVWKQWCIPEATVGSVVPHSERQRGRDAPRGEFCCEVVLRVEWCCILVVDRDGVTAQDLCITATCTSGPLFLHHHLIYTVKQIVRQEQREKMNIDSLQHYKVFHGHTIKHAGLTYFNLRFQSPSGEQSPTWSIDGSTIRHSALVQFIAQSHQTFRLVFHLPFCRH